VRVLLRERVCVRVLLRAIFGQQVLLPIFLIQKSNFCLFGETRADANKNEITPHSGHRSVFCRE